MDLAKLNTTDNKERKRFELQGEVNIAFIDYKIGKSGSMYLLHTEVPKEWEGNGVGHKMVRETLQLLDENGMKVIPLCPFIKSYIKKHLEDYQHLLDEGVKL